MRNRAGFDSPDWMDNRLGVVAPAPAGASKVLVGVATAVAKSVAMAVASPGVASAATCTWQSTASSSWGTPANWSCGALPTALDDAVFPAGPNLQNTVTNDVLGSTVGSITVTGGTYNFTGANTLFVGSQITSSATNGPNFQVPIQATGDLTITANSLGGIAFQNASIAMLAHSLTLAGPFEIDILSPIGGSGQITKSGAGLVLLAGSNTFTGPMAITTGIARLQNALALGPTNGATTVSGTGRIQLQGPITLVEPLIVNGGAIPVLDSTAGANKWNGAITLMTDATIATSVAPALTLGGQITGAGKLTVTGSAVILSSANNTFAGGLVVPAATQVIAQAPTTLGAGLVTVSAGASLRLEAGGVFPNAFSLAGVGLGSDGAMTVTAVNTVLSGLVALAANATLEVEAGGLTTTAKIGGPGGLTKTGPQSLTLNAQCDYTGSTTVGAGTLMLGAAAVLPAATALTVAGVSTFDLKGHDQTVGALSGDGSVALGAGTLTFGDATSTTFGGTISGSGGLVLKGAGTKTFTASSTHSGATQISQGTVHLKGAVWTASNVALQGGTLGLSGQGGLTQSLTATGGTFAPGFAPTRDGKTGSVVFNAATTFAADVTSTTPGQYTRLATTGTVALGGAALALSATVAPVIGNSYVILDNDGVEPLVGTFDALPEGSGFNAVGARFKVTYAGGTGNDVVLTVVEPVDAGAPDAGDSGVASSDGGGDAAEGGTADAGHDAAGNDGAAADAAANDAAVDEDATASGDASDDATVSGGGPGTSNDGGATLPGDGSASATPAGPDSGCSCTTERRARSWGDFTILGIALAWVMRRRRQGGTRSRRP